MQPGATSICGLSLRFPGRRARRGQTVIEVLFAIGVVMIGLLGVAALLPVAGYQAGRGLTADRVAAVGRSAVALFRARGMGRREMLVPVPGSAPVRRSMWLAATGPNTAVDFLDYLTSLAGPNPTPQRMAQLRAMPVCIDPRFVAENRGVVQANPLGGPDFDARYFPYYEPGSQPRMRRVTLRAVDPASNPPASLAPRPMNRVLADQIFVAHDDLVFELPEDRTLPPIQIFGGKGPDQQWGAAGVDDDGNGLVDDVAEAGWANTDDVVTRRQDEGAISWMATLTPKLDRFGAARDVYMLSIVVFHRRDSGMEMNLINERIAEVVFWSGGAGGGDVTLLSPNESDLELADGDWLMLGAFMLPPAGGREIPVFRWYRVLAADNEVTPPATSAGRYGRDVTLLGPDWDRPEWQAPPSSPLYRPTIAVLVSNVAGVYEKTIRIESSSLWVN